MKLFFCFLIVTSLVFSSKANRPVCRSFTDPNLSTFDGGSISFQYSGDHYIMYDDFKDTRVTASFERSGNQGSSNCAVYLKKRRSIVFIDFCNATGNLSPTSQFYGVVVEKNVIGPNAIRKLDLNSCGIILPGQEHDSRAWKKSKTFMEHFQCARLQGFNNYGTVIIRTVENDFEDSVLVRVQFTSRNMPDFRITPSVSSFKNTGGLCGLWDGSSINDLYVLNKDGINEFGSSVSLIESYWKLNSKFNKQSVEKRCPECNLMAERSFYCPCDNFNMFDTSNYDLELNRTRYCKVPMAECIERHIPITLPEDLEIDPVKPSISLDDALLLCSDQILNSTLSQSALNCNIDVNRTIQICASDIHNSGDLSFVTTHLQILADSILEQVLLEQNPNSACKPEGLCPGNCNGRGECVFNYECLNSPSEECLTPLYCSCDEPYGGNDCSIDLSVTPPIQIDQNCCDLRTEKCDSIQGFGYPLSTKDTIYVRVEMIEDLIGGISHTVIENIQVKATTQSSFSFKLTQLAQLGLYQNIHGSSNFTLKSGSVNVRILISYVASKFVTETRYTLYDSKCTSCNETAISLRPDTCLIDGLCFLSGDVHPNPSFDYLICNPLNPDEWTPTLDPLCPHTKNLEWTEWHNLDKPSGDGDLELFLGSFENGIACSNATYTQIVTEDGEVDISLTNQVIHFSDCFGFMCLNSEQNNGETCFDYKFRQCCPSSGPVTTTTPRPPVVSETCSPSEDYTGVIGDCKKYKRCDRGLFVVYECPPGTLFDYIRKICDYANKVTCLTATTATTVTPNPTVTATVSNALETSTATETTTDSVPFSTTQEISSSFSTIPPVSTTDVLVTTAPIDDSYSLELNVPIQGLVESGYNCLYNESYGSITTTSQLENIQSLCTKQSTVCVGGTERGGSYFRLLSCGNCLRILTSGNNGVKENSAYWYYLPGQSFGFAPSVPINLSEYVDMTDCSRETGSYVCSDKNRLSWTLDILSGWRLGNLAELRDNSYRKVLCINNYIQPASTSSSVIEDSTAVPVASTEATDEIFFQTTVPVTEQITITTPLVIPPPTLETSLTINDLLELNYKPVYNFPYNTPTSVQDLEDIRSQCSDSTILCAGGSRSNSTKIELLSCGLCQLVLQQTNGNEVNEVNGAFWYYSAFNSFGFSPSKHIDLSYYADSYDCTQVPAKSNEDVDQKTKWECTDNNRLSWVLIGSGGWRLGKTAEIGLYNDEEYHKLIFLSK